MKKSIVLIGTYNERENITPLVEAVLALGKGLHVLIIDDNSPDGTGSLADSLAAAHPEVSVIHRPGKMGLGTAYVAGFRHALEQGYDAVLTMDADFSHAPEVIPQFLDAIERCDLVVGSRYAAGGGVENWPWHRRLLSRGGSFYTRLITGLPLTDATGGFNCYRSELLRAIDFETIRCEGYSFQIETKFRAWRRGARIRELPIVFANRTRGRSKMSRRIFLEAIFMVWKMRLRKP
jgi:dolichol-phosphate mannosyltransferase